MITRLYDINCQDVDDCSYLQETQLSIYILFLLILGSKSQTLEKILAEHIKRCSAAFSLSVVKINQWKRKLAFIRHFLPKSNILF